MISLHQRRTHPTYVEGCPGCKFGTLTFGAVSGPVAELSAREKVLAADMDSYKRMRRNGYQPAHLRGSSVVEREARDPIEIEYPRLIGLDDTTRAHAAQAAQAVADIHPLLSRNAT